MFNFKRPTFDTGSQPLLAGRDFRRGKATLDFPSVAAVSHQTLTITVTGAAVGDDVMVFRDTPTAGILVDGYVSAPDTVTVRLTNITASGVDPVSMEFRCIVIKAY